MADFNFYGGPGPSRDGLAALLQASVAAQQASSAMRVDAARTLAQSLLGGLQSGIERGDRSRMFNAQQRAEADRQRESIGLRREESAQAQRNYELNRQDTLAMEAQRREDALQARDIGLQQEAAQRDLQAQLQMFSGALSQGFPFAEVGKRLPAFSGIFGAAPTTQRGPGVPGGFMQEPQAGQDPLNLALREPGYQGLASGGDDPFAGMQPMPQAQPWEQQRYALDQRQKQMVGEAALQIRRLQAQGDKNVTVQEESTLADALGWGGYDDIELEQAVLQAWPTLAPKKGLDGEEGDRRALDAKLKFLTKPRKVQVPNGAGLTGLDWSSVGGDSAVIHAAMEEVYGQEYDLPMTPEEFRAAANKKLLAQFPEYAMKFQPAQIQGGADLLSALSGQVEQERVTEALGTPGSGKFNADFATEVGIDIKQNRALQDAAAAGLQLAWENGEPVFVASGSSKPSKANQDALKALKPQVKEKIGAKLAVGSTTKMTDKELETGAAARRSGVQGRSSVRPGEVGRTQEADPQQAAPATSPQARFESSMDKYKRFLAEKTKAVKTKRPPSMSSVGISDRDLAGRIGPDARLQLDMLEMLLGAGGVR